jgi:hypothetical protein
VEILASGFETAWPDIHSLPSEMLLMSSVQGTSEVLAFLILPLRPFKETS